MSNDVIRRSDVIKAIFNKPACHGSDGSWYHSDDIRDAVDSTPFADIQQRWIPCSERLPKVSDRISECEIVLMTLSPGYVACGWINGDTAYVVINNPVHDQIVIADRKDVLAWMPIPKPWKGVDDDIR